MISKFSDLLQLASQQSNHQRLLFLFAQSESDDSSKKAESDSDNQRGTLQATMCVDKLPEEIKDYASLVKEADSISTDWDMVFIAGLDGKGDTPPSTEDAEPYLNQMTNNLSSGQDLSGYLVFDRSENLIVFQTA